MENRKIEVMEGDCCRVGYVANIIARSIVHYIKVVGLRSTMLRRHKQ